MSALSLHCRIGMTLAEPRTTKKLGQPLGFGQSSRMPEGTVARDGFRTVALFGAGLTLLFALLTFIGWISGLTLLASVRARYIPMAPSTATIPTISSGHSR